MYGNNWHWRSCLRRCWQPQEHAIRAKKRHNFVAKLNFVQFRGKTQFVLNFVAKLNLCTIFGNTQFVHNCMAKLNQCEILWQNLICAQFCGGEFLNTLTIPVYPPITVTSTQTYLLSQKHRLAKSNASHSGDDMFMKWKVNGLQF